jgi:uncharacterized protein (TIGR02594 family)
LIRVNDLLIALLVFGVRDGILAWWLIHRLLATSAVSGNGNSHPLAPAPQPPVGSPAKPVIPPSYAIAGKASWFGGPDDTGVAEDEELAFIQRVDQAPDLFLPEQPPGTTGLARRLDPSKLYIACRWDYAKTPKAYLRTIAVQVTANGKTINCRPADWGPNGRTDRAADLSPGAMKVLGIKTDDTVTVTIPLPAPTGEVTPASASAEPGWLTDARKDIGWHEIGDNRGLKPWIDLAGFGADGDPWCAIYLAAKLRKAGVDTTGLTAMARSVTASSAFTKIDSPRLGCIVVFWRGSRDGSSGHVGFWTSEDAARVQTLGGNENDQVMIEAIPKNGSTMGLLGYWWPRNLTAEPKVT